MNEKQYFAICPAEGRIEWIELAEDTLDDDNKGQVNYLKEDGTIAHPNEYIRLKKKDYIDIVCSICECPTVFIPFDVCDKEERKRVFKMQPEERIKYAERFEVLDSLDDDKEEEEM